MGDTRELAECALKGTQAAEINFNLIGIILESDKLYIPYLEVQSAGRRGRKEKESVVGVNRLVRDEVGVGESVLTHQSVYL